MSAGVSGSSGHAGLFDQTVGRAMQGVIDMVAPCPWTAHAGAVAGRRHRVHRPASAPREPIYTPEQRRRRDQSPWTLVQGLLAPIQFLVFLVSLGLVVRYLMTGEGYVVATWSVVIKTLVLYAIMVTGSIWEKVVFDEWLFAKPFFWEDVFSMLVLALHTAYLAAVFLGIGSPTEQMALALAAYFTYVINAAQFLWKLRLARLESPAS
ncbi:MAG: 2-vinyl bacteriochlorophyllide hydratase [Oceanicaulis sp.]